MKKYILITVLGILFSFVANAQKDINAWKKETTMESQFRVFKKNLNLWDGYLFFKEPQIDEYYKSIVDSISKLDQTITNNNSEIKELQTKIENLNEQLEQVQLKLDESISQQNSLETLGTSFDKEGFPKLMYSIIAGVTLIAVLAFLMYLKSNQVTASTEKKYEGLNEEFEGYKKRSLEREIKINRELQTERNKKH